MISHIFRILWENIEKKYKFCIILIIPLDFNKISIFKKPIPLKDHDDHWLYSFKVSVIKLIEIKNWIKIDLLSHFYKVNELVHRPIPIIS